MHRERLSALMDGEIFDSELIHTILQDVSLQKRWESYHLIRDSLRGGINEVIHLDITGKVEQALASEPVQIASDAKPELRPEPASWRLMHFWRKLCPCANQMAQVGVAASVAVAVIAGVLNYNTSNIETDGKYDLPIFNTVPIIGAASPVSLNVFNDQLFAHSQTEQLEQRNRRLGLMLQQYELERRSTLNRSVTSSSPIAEKPHSGAEQQ
ncbi:MAG: RseA family anti-sigma factor [Candidatus Phlomobacter fragariae]